MAMRTGAEKWTEWVGAIHMHSKYSDGRSHATAIRRVARSLNLDFCILTDHDTLAGLPEQGYFGDLLFLVGSEVTCADDSHYLALGISRPIAPQLPPQQVIDSVRRAGGVGILAHPFDRGSPLFHTGYPWHDWRVEGYDALELWSFLVDWAEGITNYAQAAWGYMFPLRYLDGPNPAGLQRWDSINRGRFRSGRSPLPIVGGVDAHGYFPYRRSLATIRTHIWARPKQYDVECDRNTILQAIRNGRSFVANDAIHNAFGFRFTVTGADATYPQDLNVVQGPAHIHIAAPRHGLIRILRNGEVVHTVSGELADFAATRAGTYRCEVLVGAKQTPWIFTNPVHVL